MKIVLNKRYGGFSLSREAFEWLLAVGNAAAIRHRNKWLESGATMEQMYKYDCCPNIERNDPDLIQVVQELGTSSGGRLSSLKIVEIPDGVEYEIVVFDGMESVGAPRLRWG